MLAAWALAPLAVWFALAAAAQGVPAGLEDKAQQAANAPPRVKAAQRFMAQRGWTPARGLAVRRAGRLPARPKINSIAASLPMDGGAASATWQPLGPAAVVTPEFGLVTGRVSALALDTSDPAGKRIYLGTTGGGVWMAQYATNPAAAAFTPLTDTLTALGGAADASTSIGAMTVQPGGTGVILAGTGDPNDLLDSYYGGGILRSTDGGSTWTLISRTRDVEDGLGAQDFSFLGEGFAGFAWSTADPQVVVAAVSQAWEGTLVNAAQAGISYQGLYYSNDSGESWHLATITDGGGSFVQGPLAAFAAPDGNAATAVVWNAKRGLFVAAVRYHGYYQSADGVTWTRMASQPGAGLTTLLCPNNPGSTGSFACPIFRGALAVNPETGDTFAWTVNSYNPATGLWPDLGIWQDQCGLNGSACGNQAIAFAKLPWLPGTSATEPAIADGGYTLALAAVPAGVGAGYDTLLFAGADDLWKCSLAMGCQWRNTTNATTGFCAQVGAYQHALAWDPGNPLQIFVGNDSGLWSSSDGIGESGALCPSSGNSDASHFQNLNGNLGSLADVVSISAVTTTPYTMMSGLGANGTVGVKSGAATTNWPQILGGYGGPVSIDPRNSSNWYVNNESGVSIYLCAQATPCAAADFGSSPVVSNVDVSGDGLTMPTPAPFLVDPLDPTQLLVGTCRVWRGPGDGSGWSQSNAVSDVLDGGVGGTCKGDALIRSMAAMPLGSGGEVVYLGMYGSANGGANLPGHVLSAVVKPPLSAMPEWHDLTLGKVDNDRNGLNAFGLDISSLFIDPHDPSGNTVYVTVEGVKSPLQEVQVVYRTTDGGKHWTDLTANLPATPASSVVVDPQEASTVYVATDEGVYFTTEVGSCGLPPYACWSVFGTGLPEAPAVALSASPAGTAKPVLVAATYGRGIWQTPLWTAGANLTAAVASPASLSFASQMFGTTSAAQTVTIWNTGNIALTPTTITKTGDFNETDNCQNMSVAVGANCTIQVTFRPTAVGQRTGQMIVSANVYGGQLTVDLGGTGTPSGSVSLTPPSIDFGQVAVGAVSDAVQVQAGNSGTAAVQISSVTITSPFTIATNLCGSASLDVGADCQVRIEFAPTQIGAAAGTLTFTDAAGTQTVELRGTGAVAPTDVLNPSSLSFPATGTGELSDAQTITLTNVGDLPLKAISITVSGDFRDTDNCGTQLAPHSVCTITVVFAPTQQGSLAGTLTVKDALRTQTAGLAGAGAAAPVLSVSPGSLNFPMQLPGVASSPLTLTVRNTGGVAMAGLGFQIASPAAASFAKGATTCGTSLDSGSSCTMQVIFTPATTGGSAATLSVYSSSVGVAGIDVPLSGSAQLVSGLGVNPAHLSFAAANPGQPSAPQIVTVSNTSGFAMQSLSLSLSVASPFSLAQNTCSGTLAAGANCTAGVIFTPVASGAAAGILTVSSSSVATAATVALSGTGAVPAEIRVTPSPMNLGAAGPGTASGATAFVVTNPGTLVSLSNLTLAVSTGFQLVNNTCTSTLATQASCGAGVEFIPGSVGPVTGSLTVISSSVNGNTVVALSGMGFDFTPSVSGSSAVTVSAGQTANYVLKIDAASGVQGTFTYGYTCGTLPAYALCLFNPTSTAASAGNSGYVTISISTGSGSAALTGDPAKWRMAPLLCGLVLLPLAWRRRRKALLLFVLLAVTAGAVSSCTSAGLISTGGSGGSSKGSRTPAGTYTIPVTVTSSGVSHAVTLTLAVD